MPVVRLQPVDELERVLHHRPGRAEADVALVDQQQDGAARAARRWRRCSRCRCRLAPRRRGCRSGARRWPASERIDQLDVLGGEHLARPAVDLDLELRRREVDHLAAVAIEDGDVDRQHLDAGAEHRWLVGRRCRRRRRAAAGAGVCGVCGAWACERRGDGERQRGRLRRELGFMIDAPVQVVAAAGVSRGAAEPAAPPAPSPASIMTGARGGAHGRSRAVRYDRRSCPRATCSSWGPARPDWPPPSPAAITASTTRCSNRARSWTPSPGFPPTWCSSPRPSCSRSAACR